MKLQDIYEAEQPNANLQAVITELKRCLIKARSRLEGSQVDDRMYSLGGNFRGHVSGQLDIRAPYVQHGAYNTSIQWDFALIIGSGIPNALAEAKKVYQELEAVVKGFDIPLQVDHGGVAHYDFDAETVISIKYDYARSFCTAMYRVSKR